MSVEMLLHERHLISPFGLKRYSGKLLSRAGKEQSAQTLVPVHVTGWRGFVWWDLRFPGDTGLSPGYGYKQSLPQPQGSSRRHVYGESPHLSQLHLVAAGHVCLCSSSRGPREGPWGGQGWDLSLCPSQGAGCWGQSFSHLCCEE